MHLRRPVAAVLTVLALSAGGASLAGCGAAGQDQKDGTTDDTVDTTVGPGPNYSDPEQGQDEQDRD